MAESDKVEFDFQMFQRYGDAWTDFADLKAGQYQIDGVGHGTLVPKAPSGYKFFVAELVTGQEKKKAYGAVWNADLEKAGEAPAGHELAGKKLYKLKGTERIFISEGTNLHECRAKDLVVKYKWHLTDVQPGTFRTSAAAPRPGKDYPTANFKKAILGRDVALNSKESPNVSTVLQSKAGCGETIPADVKEKRALMVKAYTQESPLYHEMNTALRNDDLEQIQYFASYINALRDCFKTDHTDQIIEPFDGQVWRGINFPDQDEAMQTYKVGSEFVWPSFTSMTTNKEVALGFGNVTFEIKCKPPADMTSDDTPEYSPGDICNFSAFGSSEAEILFPPNTLFKVLAIWMPGEEHPELQSPLIKCKTMGFDSDEGISAWGGKDADKGQQLTAHEQAIDEHDMKLDEMDSKLANAKDNSERLDALLQENNERDEEMTKKASDLKHTTEAIKSEMAETQRKEKAAVAKLEKDMLIQKGTEDERILKLEKMCQALEGRVTSLEADLAICKEELGKPGWKKLFGGKA